MSYNHKIDFHTHVFPDKVAVRAIPALAEAAHFTPFHGATVASTLAAMTGGGVDKSVVLPIASTEKQQKNVNDFAASINGDRFICFGSVYPFCDGTIEELDRIRALGLHGVKLHPEYQNFEVADKRAYAVYEYCDSYGLPLIFHAGYDPAFMHRCNAAPAALAKIHDDFPDLKLICAHYGGYLLWDDVYENLAGKENVYLDTSFSLGYIDEALFLKILGKHNPDNVLFATDSPWGDAKENGERLEGLGLSDATLEKIYRINAEKLLKL